MVPCQNSDQASTRFDQKAGATILRVEVIDEEQEPSDRLKNHTQTQHANKAMFSEMIQKLFDIAMP